MWKWNTKIWLLHRSTDPDTERYSFMRIVGCGLKLGGLELCNWWNIRGDVKKTRIKKVLWTVEWKAFVVHEDECCILIWVKSPAFCLLNSLCSLDVEETWMKHRNKQHGLKSTNHKPWPFELVEVNMCFLGGLLRWLTEQKKSLQTRSAI